MKNKGIGIMVLTLSIIFSLVANHIGAAENQSKLSTIAEKMENKDLEISKWSLYSKKFVENKSIKELKQMTKQYRQYTWTFEQEDDVFKAIGVYENTEKNITEKLQFLATLTNDQEQSYIIYEVIGTGTNRNWNEVDEFFAQRSFDIFHENPTIYACIEGIVGDKMEEVLNLTMDELLTEFSAKPIEELTEQDFLSVSAKTSLWEDFIPTKEDSMNIQIALRSDGMGAKTTVVIGTPIITSEY
ncbi:YwmB family TATA-box binding protein [Metabacillus schmidteae]|uniref:YwmB family TATA-box binding protein n=1 Tax=Metabacillus schmidteae TaxID=2730405 RepID=UPI00158B5DB2|nr:YwmB family TATA-box binding protein [Metabacillus schmidteae]